MVANCPEHNGPRVPKSTRSRFHGFAPTTVYQELELFRHVPPNATTISDVLTAFGLADTDMDTLVDNLFGTTTVNQLLTDLGLNTVTIDGLLTELGLADVAILDTDIGDFFGFIPALLNGLPQQIAQALGA